MRNHKRTIPRMFYCLWMALLTACGGMTPRPVAVPIEMEFDTTLQDVAGGVRLAPQESQWDGYGEAVAVRGEVLVIGASEWNQLGPGSAYVYRLVGETWQEQAQLFASDRDEGQFAQRFGNAVALGEGMLAIGAPGNDDPEAGENSGAVYLFERQDGAWVETAKLIPDSPKEELEPVALKNMEYVRMRPRAYGALVALSGDTLAVGGSPEGLVYLYQRGGNGWQEQARVSIPASPGRDLYMGSMALYGDALALSAFYVLPRSEQDLFLQGNAVVYAFERSGEAWQESFNFKPEGQEDILFLAEVNIGASIALGGASGTASLLAVGLPGFPDWRDAQDNIGLFGANPGPLDLPASNRQAGAVYLFERAEGSWIRRVTLKPAGWETPPGAGSFPLNAPTHLENEAGNSEEASPTATPDLRDSFVFPGHLFSANPEVSFFGATVDLDGDRLAVTGGYTNTTYVFEREGQDWSYRFSLRPSPDGQLWEDYAQAVVISGRTLLLGTPGEFGNSAYVFDLCAPQMLDCK